MREFMCFARIEFDCFQFPNYLIVLVPPKPPVIRVHRVTSNYITLRWTNGDIGNSPIIAYRIKYKITYGEWAEKLVRPRLMVLIRLKIIQNDIKIYDLKNIFSLGQLLC